MGIRLAVKDSETGNRVTMDLEPDTSVEEVIEAAADHWKKDPGAYVLRFGKKLLRGDTTVGSVDPVKDDTFELIPDPEGGAAGA